MTTRQYNRLCTYVNRNLTMTHYAGYGILTGDLQATHVLALFKHVGGKRIDLKQSLSSLSILFQIDARMN